MTAWLATAVAIVASMTSGSSNTGAGQRRKKRLPSTGPPASTIAACPA